MEITIKFRSVADGLPPKEEMDLPYSIECLAIVGGEIHDRSGKYHLDEGCCLGCSVAKTH